MSPQKKIARHRLQTMVPDKIFQEILRISEARNMTVTMVVIQALLKRIREETQYE